MTLVSTAELVADATRRGGAVAAVNVVTLEHAEAICAAAEAAGLGVILQISENAVRYHGGRLEPIAAASAAVARLAAVPVSLHLDHVTDDGLVAQAAAHFSSVMYDAGALPYEENVARTARAARVAHASGLWVEAELGYVGGKPDAPRSAHAPGCAPIPTRPWSTCAHRGRRAGRRGRQLARDDRADRPLDTELIGRLRDRLDVPLVLHGSSGVPDGRAARGGRVRHRARSTSAPR